MRRRLDIRLRSRFSKLLTMSTPQTDPGEVLLHIAWWGYLLAALLYSLAVFSIDRSSKASSKPCSKSFLEMFVTHAIFLTILLCALRAMSFVAPSLPLWLTDGLIGRSTSKLSIFDFVFLGIGYLLGKVETQKLFGDSG